MQAMQISVAAILCAAGSSRRFAGSMGGVKKEYAPLPGKNLTVLGAALGAFASSPRIETIVITVPPGAEEEARASLGEALAGQEHSRILFVSGGPTRRASVHNALLLLESCHPSHVLIHDGARPWIKPDLVERIIDAAIRFDAVIPALPLLETPKELAAAELAGTENSAPREGPAFIKRHLKRAELCFAQTPQGFRFPEILKAHEKAAERESKEQCEYTDDAEVWGEFIGQVAVIPGDPENKKITYPEDL